MRKIVFGLVTVFAIIGFGTQSFGQQGPVETVKQGCKTELESFCKDVTPGNQRVLACLYAFSDKISAQCEYAVYDAAAQLERAVAALSYVINECDDDVEKLCPNVEAGKGRIVKCLEGQKTKVSNRCVVALQNTGLMK